MTTRSVRRVPVRAIATQYVAALIALAVTAVFGYLLLQPQQSAGTAEAPRSSVTQPH
ncbi:hypothetical protein ABZV58_10900 [Nocardia sp. NPDC004654]|uniref:hypothetical protein n=1 Tax=Nocardia sp. NPDC004654 TaxID=3154776 RepID=UPI0033A0D3C7